jgi:hypothetical protein
VNITSSYKSNQLLWLVLKLLTVILCCYFIFTNIAFNEELKFIDFYTKMINFGVFSSKNIIFMLFFTIINHFLEIKKWKTLTKSVKNNSWFDSKRIKAYFLGSLLYPFFSSYVFFKSLTSSYTWKERVFKR